MFEQPVNPGLAAKLEKFVRDRGSDSGSWDWPNRYVNSTHPLDLNEPDAHLDEHFSSDPAINKALNVKPGVETEDPSKYDGIKIKAKGLSKSDRDKNVTLTDDTKVTTNKAGTDVETRTIDKLDTASHGSKTVHKETHTTEHIMDMQVSNKT